MIMQMDTTQAGSAVQCEVRGLNEAEFSELSRLAEDGKLLPEAVVEAASDSINPLHHRFEWNEGKAAHAYRVFQARQLILHVKVIYPDCKPQRYWVHLRSERFGYRALDTVLRVHPRKMNYAVELLEDLMGLIAKYEGFAQGDRVLNNSRSIGPLSAALKKLRGCAKAIEGLLK